MREPRYLYQIPGLRRTVAPRLFRADLTSVFDDITMLCRMFCADDLRVEMERFQHAGVDLPEDQATAGAEDIPSDEAKEEEEEEEEEAVK